MNAIKTILSTTLIALALAGCSKQAPENADADTTQATAAPSMPSSPPEPTPTEVTPVVTEETTESMEAVEEIAEEASEPAADAPASVGPTTHIIKGVITQWQPLVTFAQPGDTIKFTNMTGHDTASMEGMIPEGASEWHSKLGEEGYTITVEKEGAYVYKCTPHITTGMVGIIVVGDKNPKNMEQIEQNAGNVKIGGNMVKRAIRKLKKQLEST